MLIDQANPEVVREVVEQYAALVEMAPDDLHPDRQTEWMHAARQRQGRVACDVEQARIARQGIADRRPLTLQGHVARADLGGPGSGSPG